MERTEELVQNLLTAQNELISHLSILKGVPNLARALFGPVEKKFDPRKNSRPPEKNSTPEKNSSEAEEIRKEWMDDVVGLASEFFINEESFNVKNLSDLMISTACALDALLNIKTSVDQTDSVDQIFRGGHVHANHEKKFTFLDKLREDEPDFKNNSDEDIWSNYCPSEFGYEEGCTYEKAPISERCSKCWKREYHYPDTDSAKPLTCREKAKQDNPYAIGENFCGGVYLCPHDYGYSEIRYCSFGCNKYTIREETCTACWNQPVQPKSV